MFQPPNEGFLRGGNRGRWRRLPPSPLRRRRRPVKQPSPHSFSLHRATPLLSSLRLCRFFRPPLRRRRHLLPTRRSRPPRRSLPRPVLCSLPRVPPPQPLPCPPSPPQNPSFGVVYDFCSLSVTDGVLASYKNQGWFRFAQYKNRSDPHN